MKHLKKRYIFFGAALQLVISCIVAAPVLVNSLNDLFSIHGSGQTIVNLKQPYTIYMPANSSAQAAAANSNGSVQGALTLDDFKNIKSFLTGLDIAVLSKDSAQLQNRWNTADANIFATNSSYQNFNKMKLIYGRFTRKEDDNKASNVVVVSSDLADSLYGSTNVVGKTLSIYGEDFTIIGVCESTYSFIDSFLQSGVPSAYIPINTYTNIKGNANITTLEVSTDKVSKVQSAVTSIGKIENRYNFVDVSRDEKLITQKVKILLFIIGIILIIKLALILKKTLEEVYKLITKGEFTPENKKFLICILKIISLVLAVTGIWVMIKFQPYVSKQYLPSGMPNIKFLKDLFKNVVTERMQSMGYIPSLSELRLQTVNTLTNWLFYAALLTGIPMFLSLKPEGIQKYKTIFKI